MAAHLRPCAPTAPDALLPGDPGRSLALAQELIERPRMSNHARGLWGYHGEAANGCELTVQATGIGGPSAAIVLRELAELGVRRAIRIGRCRPLAAVAPNGAAPRSEAPELIPGTAVVASAALAADGTSRAIAGERWTRPDEALTAAVRDELGAGAVLAPVASSDLYYEQDRLPVDGEPDPGRWLADGAVAVEMGAAGLFALGRRIGVELACALVVADAQPAAAGRPGAGGEDPVERRAIELGRACVRALARRRRASAAA
jgi:uridine phosphorylase